MLMNINMDDTIVAISTPVGEGGIGIVRLSGPEAISIVRKIFRAKGGRDIKNAPNFTLHYGHIIEPDEKQQTTGGLKQSEDTYTNLKEVLGNSSEAIRPEAGTERGTRTDASAFFPRIIDEVLVTVMRAPKTYTRQDVVEINCHGGIVPLKKVMDLTLRYGARLAGPGEFTQRAFLNGRIDLCQAEAVLDVIRARTDEALSVAVAQLDGRVSDEINRIRNNLLDILAQVEAAIDFPEEDLEIYSEVDLLRKLKEIVCELNRILDTAQPGIILRQGIMAVIVGRPNVGKSSLMNAILKKDRVIVTPVPGTTRDAVEEMANIKGVPVRVVDTAGLRPTEDEVEKESVERSRSYLGLADLVLLVFDITEDLNQEDLYIIDEIKRQKKKTIVVLNKIDRPARLTIEQVQRFFEEEPVVRTSATRMDGLNRIEEAISDLVWQGKIRAKDEVLLSNMRHKEAIEKSLKNLASACGAVEEHASPEFPALDIKETLDNLGLIVGQTTTEDLLDRIFSNFCIGK